MGKNCVNSLFLYRVCFGNQVTFPDESKYYDRRRNISLQKQHFNQLFPTNWMGIMKLLRAYFGSF